MIIPKTSSILTAVLNFCKIYRKYQQITLSKLGPKAFFVHEKFTEEMNKFSAIENVFCIANLKIVGSNPTLANTFSPKNIVLYAY